MTADDVVYVLAERRPAFDLAITAARDFGARSVAPMDPTQAQLVDMRRAGVTNRVRFYRNGWWEAVNVDIDEATVVLVHLLPVYAARLQTILPNHLKPGSRIVSWAYILGDWPAEKDARIGDQRILLWTIPRR